MLNTIYNQIKHVKPLLKQSIFFDYIVLPEATHANDAKTKEKYIRKMPQKIVKYYSDSNYTNRLTEYLQDWCTYLGTELSAAMEIVSNYFRQGQNLQFSNKIATVARIETAPTFFYAVFRYCLTHDDNFDIYSNAKLDMSYLEEFNRIILQQYGVSGRSGNQVIMQLAKSGTKNPYILFEAAEIEYTYPQQKSDPHGVHLEKAYEYYKMASDSGYALADWSLGYLAQKSYEKPWHIKAYDNMSDIQKIETAIFYYKKAANNDCARAFNSLGNLASNSSIFSRFANQLEPAKHYYKMAAEKENIDGMYNYARTLEKELLVLCNENSRKTVKNKSKQIENECSVMLTYYKKAADLGKAAACYRCALYYGHMTDENNSEMKDANFGNIELNMSTSIRYLEKAILLGEKPIFDAYLILSRYILENSREFFDCKQSLLEAEHYLSFLSKSSAFNNKATLRQKKLLSELQGSLKELKKELRSASRKKSELTIHPNTDVF